MIRMAASDSLTIMSETPEIRVSRIFLHTPHFIATFITYAIGKVNTPFSSWGVAFALRCLRLQSEGDLGSSGPPKAA